MRGDCSILVFLCVVLVFVSALRLVHDRDVLVLCVCDVVVS